MATSARRPDLGRAVAVGLVGALLLGCNRAPKPQPNYPEEARANDAEALPAFVQTDPDQAAAIERFHVLLGDAPVRGPADAPVTIVMFSDFECPFCQKGHETVQELERRYPGKIRIAYKAFPLDMHENALVAAMAARAAQSQGKFWEFHDRLFSQRGLSIARLLEYAEETGLNLESLKRDIESLEYGPEVRRDLRQGRQLGVSSTPSFFINGRPLSGARPLAIFTQIVEDELTTAQTWQAQGVAPSDLYEHAIKDGYRKVVYTERGRQIDPDGVFPVPVTDSPALGPATAPITIVVFGDFECPFCGRGFATVKAVQEIYGDKVRVVYKHYPLPFHSHAFIAARAALAANAQGKFWAYHDALYELGAKFDEDDLVTVARKTGLNMKKFFKAMNSQALDAQIEADQALALSLGVTGTPAYFVNGRPIQGAVPEIQFRLLIEEELERAQAALERGVDPKELYDALTHQPLDP